MTARPGRTRHIKRRRSRQAIGSIAAAVLAALFNTSVGATEDGDQSVAQLRDLSIEDLGNIEITSVSKTPEPLSDAAAAIYVITHDEIMRSGRGSLPEILRMAPNLQVAQVSANSYAITARGFNGTTTLNGAGNKLLVLIDGRSVYTPLYAGVFWDLQYVPPETIDRIEVISGPGAALWGANAVNGVINIITRSSADTQGSVVSVQAGNLDLGANAQYSGRLDPETTLRIYGAGFQRDNNVTNTGADAEDGWRKFQTGFRLDWAPENGLLTVQGDIFKGAEDQALPPNAVIGGHNLLARWSQTLDGGSSLQIQAYYDYNTIHVPGSLGNSLSTFDVDLQHSFSWGADQDIVWGGDYRHMQNTFNNQIPSSTTNAVAFLPPKTTHHLASAFVQDTISLSDSVKLILGAKLEDDPFVGLQFLPSARASWKPMDGTLVWAAVSRAVRAPALWDRNLNEYFGTTDFLSGGHFQSEELMAYEAGYRGELSPDLSLSLSLYYNAYDKLRSIEFTPVTFLPLAYGNKMYGHTYGAEFWGTWDITDWWRLSAGANLEHEALKFRSDSFSAILGPNAPAPGDDPPYQFSLQSSMDLPHDLKLDVAARKIGRLPNPVVPSYFEMDARLAWNVMDNLELSVAGFNLLHDHHPEFATTGAPNEIPRSVVASVRWAF